MASADNSFGALRLLLALQVIVSHAYAHLNDAPDEPLIRTFGGSTTFGDVAVDGFFTLSGYLITASFLNSRGLAQYAGKRVLRIYRAFVVAFVVCVTIVAPIGGVSLSPRPTTIVSFLKSMLLLESPTVQGVFPGTPYPVLNGATWTIAYEFRCYVLVALLGVIGLLRRPKLMATLTLALLAMASIRPLHLFAAVDALPLARFWLGGSDATVRLDAVFLAGCCLYLYRRQVPFTTPLSLIAAALVIGGLAGRLATLAMATGGAYLLIGLAGRRLPLIGRLNRKNDISYGTYLYAWPISKLLVMTMPAVPVFPLILLTAAGALMAGKVSWHVIERPALKLVAR